MCRQRLVMSQQHLANRAVVVRNHLFIRVAFLVCLLAQQGESASRVSAASLTDRQPQLYTGYLFPAAVGGPNNQVTGTKEVLTLGRLLNRTVILPPAILHHMLDHGQPDKDHWEAADLSFPLVFDLPYLARRQNVVMLEEHKAAGWDGKLDAIYYSRDKNIKQVWWAKLGIPGAARLETRFQLPLRCNPSNLGVMAEKISEYRYVAIATYQDIVANAGHTVFSNLDKDRCLQAYYQVTSNLRKSPGILGLVSAFREKYLGGRNSSYVAVHVRPYPDICLQTVWRGRYNLSAAIIKCDNPWLYDAFVPQTLAIMRKHGVVPSPHALFVMCHPVLQPLVKKMYNAAGLQPVFYHEHDTEATLGFKSLSLIGMLEQEVCAQATAFSGTEQSSMTGMVKQERVARGMPASSTTSFFNPSN